MKRFFAKIAAFVCFAALCYPAMLVVWGHVVPLRLNKNFCYQVGAYGHLHSRVREARTFGRADVLVVGSSHVYRGYDPRVFAEHGLRLFNLGSSSQSPLQTEVLLAHSLDRLNPRLVLYDVYPGGFAVDGVESAVDLVSNDVLDADTFRMVRRVNHIKVYNTLLFALFRKAWGLDRNFVEPRVVAGDRYVEGGFVERLLSSYTPRAHYPPYEWVLREKHKAAFERILAGLRARNIRVVLVQAPISRPLWESCLNNDEADAYFRRQGPYYNFNGRLPLSDREHFFDADHLNQAGAERFGAELIRLLRDEGWITCESPPAP
ncbi:MAG: hypothetical protein KKC51_07420 [Verrucomicrobia bacterium]|nr:hypothetical protein [Verrucomicrobiota bacterium]